ncbi:MAG: hypothetical protein H7Y31_14065 [Chitinophagaceae bacterium]|nr:hypothetical protein [Chitinophagaceae bacterium]
MNFLVASLPEFLQFLKIMLWISIPIFLVSTLTVVFLHYRKKRRAESELHLEPVFNLVTPSYPLPREHYLQQLKQGFDQFHLLQEDFNNIKLQFSATNNNDGEVTDRSLQEKLSKQELKIAQLKQAVEYLQANAGKEEDFGQHQENIAEKEKEIARLHALIKSLNQELALSKQQYDSRSNELNKMDQLLKEFQQSAKHASTEARGLHLSFQEQTEGKDKFHFEENQRLSEQLKLMHDSFHQLEEENIQLQNKLQQGRLENLAGNEAETRIAELQNALIRSEQELLEWKNKKVDADSLVEIVEEKKAQINFLQNQLDQRIRANRQLEQDVHDKEKQWSQSQQDLQLYEQKQQYLFEDISNKQEELTQLTKQLEDGSAESRQLKESILMYEEKIAEVEKSHLELNDNLGNFQEELRRSREVSALLEQQLSDSRQHINLLENKLAERQQLISKMHTDLSSILDENPSKPTVSDFHLQSLPHLVEEV